MPKLNLRRAFLSALLVVSLPCGAAYAEIKTVSNSTAANLQTQCLLQEDHHTSGTNHRFTRCCSFTLGYCIECTMHADELCEKIAIREGLKRKIKGEAPATAGVVAPRSNTGTTGAVIGTQLPTPSN